MEIEPVNDTWLSGKPYYCIRCGAGGGEYMACEEVDCELEDEKEALNRLLNHQREMGR